MMENKSILHVYDAAGKAVGERDLSDAPSSLMVVCAAGEPAFVTSTDPDADIVAALVRDEDGWTLAAASATRPVVSGEKRVPELQLVAGLPCRVGDWVFRLERAGTESGLALVWRYHGSPVAVDPVVPGRNVVALDRTTRRPEVNPTLPEDDLFSLYPTADGIDVAVSDDSGDRLSVGFGELFSVGPFEGMLLTNADAAKAIRTSRPFAWPSRRTRWCVRLALFAVAGLFVLTMFVSSRVNDLRAALEGPRGATETAYAASDRATEDGDNETVYNLTFYRMLPVVLVAEPNAATLDLLNRGRLFDFEPGVARKVRFLKDVRTIQETVKAGRWDELQKTLGAADAAMFAECDADEFLSDAREVCDFIVKTIPAKLVAASEIGHRKELDDLTAELDRVFRGLEDNIFLRGEVFARERENIVLQQKAVTEYVCARDRVLGEAKADPPACTRESLDALSEALANLTLVFDRLGERPDCGGTAWVREKDVLAGLVRACVAAVLKRSRTDDAGTVSSLLEPLSDIAEAAEMPGAEIVSWREQAKAAAKRVDALYRQLYSKYRMQSAVDPAAAGRVLDEILAVGDVRNGFHVWALREKERLGHAQQNKEGVK